MVKLKIKKGDTVIVISGKDKGRKGEVLKVLPKLNRAFVSGINIVHKHVKLNKTTESSGILQKESSINISNISHINPKTGKQTKILFKFLENGSKIRVCKKSGEIISEKKGK